jgi:hypothetical protein
MKSKVIHPVLGKGVIVGATSNNTVIVDFDKPIKGWQNPIEVKKSILKGGE